ncbi:MAG: hypothetical protein QOE90_2115 [Thermoplasmata archaeon]|jgi:hypothetical protein|nr:hypothetical protein [Thermoplasmata archaeon]
MLIDEPKSDPHRPKEVKVKVPIGHHVKLHSMKVLTGKPISDAVIEALDLYFEQVQGLRARPEPDSLMSTTRQTR